MAKCGSAQAVKKIILILFKTHLSLLNGSCYLVFSSFSNLWCSQFLSQKAYEYRLVVKQVMIYSGDILLVWWERHILFCLMVLYYYVNVISVAKWTECKCCRCGIPSMSRHGSLSWLCYSQVMNGVLPTKLKSPKWFIEEAETLEG